MLDEIQEKKLSVASSPPLSVVPSLLCIRWEMSLIDDVH